LHAEKDSAEAAVRMYSEEVRSLRGRGGLGGRRLRYLECLKGMIKFARRLLKTVLLVRTYPNHQKQS
jgi:hypothetical protein